MSKTIEMALASSKKLSQDQAEREALVAEGTRLAELRDNLLPFEEAAKTALEGQIETLREAVRVFDTAAAVGNLPRLDQNSFAWTKKQKLWGRKAILVPSLAYVPISDRELTLWTNHRGEVRINGEAVDSRYPRTRYPATVEKHYITTMTAIGREYLSWDDRDTLALTYRYPGIVPEEIKVLIREEEDKKRFDRLAFVCDVDHWQVNVTQAPRREFLDPILVGEKAGTLWVIASFDPTPLEKYVSSEFTS